MVQLVSKGAQDVYLTDAEKGEFPFKTMYSRYRNFSHAPKKLSFIGQVEPNGTCIMQLTGLGDLLTGLWMEGQAGSDLSVKLKGSKFELYIGGQLIDSQTYDYMAEIWQAYLPENQAKFQTWNNLASTTNDTFFPLHFFFCDNNMFLPLLALQYHPAEIRITWGPNVTSGLALVPYGNFVFLDTKDREEFTKKPLDILITQVQKTIASTPSSIDLSVFNHPVKAMFFGIPLGLPPNPKIGTGFTFRSADILINGTYLLEQMSPTYFYTAQVYYRTQNGVVNIDPTATVISPSYTQYFMYSFALDASSYRPTGTCNFSRLDNAKMNIDSPVINSTSMTIPLTVYALNYNVLRIKQGMAGVLFGN